MKMPVSPSSQRWAYTAAAVILFLAGLGTILYLSVVFHLVLGLIYAWISSRRIVPALSKMHVLAGMLFTLFLSFVAAAIFFGGGLIFSSIDGGLLDGETRTWWPLLVFNGSLYVFCGHVVVLELVVFGSAIARRIAPVHLSASRHPLEEDLGEKPGWDKGGQPPHKERR